MQQLVSVIIPVYNTAAYLPACIESVVHQTYSDLEIILIDDGSTDNSLEICMAYAQNDERITVIDKPNGGQASARNLGLDKCTGSYIAFIDSDDTIALDTLEKNVPFLEADTDLDFVQFPIFMKYGSEAQYLRSFSPKVIAGQTNLFKAWIEKDEISWIVCNKIFRKAIFDNVRFPEGMVYEDNYVVADTLDKSNKAMISNHGLYYYFDRAQSTTTSTHSEKKELNTQKVSLRIYESLLQHPELSTARSIMLNRIINVASSLKKNFNKQAMDYLPTNLNAGLKDIKQSGLPKSQQLKMQLLKIIGPKNFFRWLVR